MQPFLPNMFLAIVFAMFGFWEWAAMNLAISLIFAISDI